MTASSHGVKYAALLVAVLSHGALAVALAVPEEYLIEGGSGSAEVQLGDAFADLVAGTLSAEPADTVAPESPSDHAAQDMPDRVTPTPVARAQPIQATPATPPDAARSEPLTAPPAAHEAHSDVTPPEAPTLTAPEPVADDALPLSAHPAPQLAETFAPPATPDRITATGPEADTPAVTRSVRPPARPEPPVVAAKRPDPARPDPARAAPRGNADRNARAGDATGAQAVTARHSGNAGQVQAAGNAAASNYPGLVMRRLSRAGQPRVNARGAAVVAFVIGDTGRLTSVSLARSSGADALDRAALQLVQGAGPFPAPPAGAQRQFTIQIEGR